MKKVCVECNKEHNNDFNFCPKCGSKLEILYGKEMLEEGYRDTKGEWIVVDNSNGAYPEILGIYDGNIDDIAFSIKREKENIESIKFIRAKKRKYTKGLTGAVLVEFDEDSGLFGLNDSDSKEALLDLFSDRVDIVEYKGVTSFKIIREV